MKQQALRAAVLGVVLTAHAAPAPQRPIPAAELKSGIAFASAAVRALQDDEFGNPGMLWVERGEALWRSPAGSTARSCASCHQDARVTMKGVAARYPSVDAKAGLLDLAGRINQCRQERQHADGLAHESDELLALTAYVAHQSRGMPIAVSIDGPARTHYEAGRVLYHTRLGQMNLSCAHCHDANWGRKLAAETISQGHGNAYPIYRLEWQTVGSLHRRFRSCLSGIRAEMLPYDAPAYVELELYIAWRATGLPIETPGVRR